MKQKFMYCSPDEICVLSLRLAKKIIDSKYRPNILVGPLRGCGWPLRNLSDLLAVSETTTIRIEHYDYGKVGGKREKPEITQPCQVDVRGKKVLLVDDVTDSGGSLGVGKDYIKGLGAEEVRTAVLHYKPWSDFKPDYVADESDAWIIYQWECREFVEDLLKNENYADEEKKTILHRSGIPEDYLKEILGLCGYDYGSLKPFRLL